MRRSFEQPLNAVKSKMFPHVFAVFQFILLILYVIPFANSPIMVAGRVDHALKTIMLFHLWILTFSIILFALFYRIRGKEIEEKCIAAMLFTAAMFSAFNFALHFVDNFVLWMWVTENVAIALYLIVPIIGVYEVSKVFLFPLLRRFRKSEQR